MEISNQGEVLPISHSLYKCLFAGANFSNSIDVNKILDNSLLKVTYVQALSRA